MRTLLCGCVHQFPWTFRCETARQLETKLIEAIRDKDWEAMRERSRLLSAHLGEGTAALGAVRLALGPDPSQAPSAKHQAPEHRDHA